MVTIEKGLGKTTVIVGPEIYKDVVDNNYDLGFSLLGNPDIGVAAMSFKMSSFDPFRITLSPTPWTWSTLIETLLLRKRRRRFCSSATSLFSSTLNAITRQS